MILRKHQNTITILLFSFFHFIVSCKNLSKENTSVEKSVNELISTLNNRDKEINNYVLNNFSKKFIESFPMEMHVNMLSMIRNDFAPLEIDSMKLKSSSEGQCILKGRNDQMLEVNIVLTDNNKIDLLGLRPVMSNFKQDKDEKPELHADAGPSTDFSGAVIRRDIDGRSTLENIGYSDIENEIKINETTKFNLASLSKIFTIISILQLRDKQFIKLNDPIGVYTDIFSENISSEVTVMDLLTHKSGWGHYWDNEIFVEKKDQLSSVSDYMEFIKDIPIEGETGKTFNYSNIGYEVLGHIIERVSKKSFYDYVEENIFDRCNMTASGYFFSKSHDASFAKGYLSATSDNSDFLPAIGTPAGGAYSTAKDLAKFNKCLMNNSLIRRSGLEQIKDEILPRAGKNKFNIAGGAPGMNTILSLDLKTGESIIILSNQSPPCAEKMYSKILEVK